MGEQRNLTEENVEDLKAKLDMMQKDNPTLEYRFFDQDAPQEPIEQDEQPDNKAIFEKLEAIERQLDRIFGDHIFLDGSFVNIKPQQSE